MQVLDLFSGIGGFSLAAHSLGWETAAFCEIDPYCQQVLRRHYPDVPIFDDVKELTADALADAISGKAERWREYGFLVGAERRPVQQVRDAPWRSGEGRARSVDLLTAGFPCQDISYAGKGAGLDGERSGLFFEVARLVGEIRPRYVLLENVAALITRGADVVLGTLAGMGYDAVWGVVRASDVGAPHRRARIWILAYPEGTAGGQRIAGSVLDRLTPCPAGWSTPNVDDAHNWTRDSGKIGSLVRDTRQSQENMDNGSLNPEWVETLMGYPIGYTLPAGPRMLTMPDRWPMGMGTEQHEWEPPRLTTSKQYRASRLKCLGNSIVPQVARLWMQAIDHALCA